MALEDIKAPGKRGSNMYKIVARFLKSNVGRPWAQTYSKLCAVADGDTYLGREIRRMIERDVDMNTKAVLQRAYHYSDYYVDHRGILIAYPKRHWKNTWRDRKTRAPIERVCFEGDGPDIYYELIEIPDGPRASKYTKLSKAWFRVVRTVEVRTVTLDPMEVARKMIGNKDMKKGKKDYYREVSHETFNKTQVGGSILVDLRYIAARCPQDGVHHIKNIKISRLTYGNVRDEKGLTAHVKGKSV